jgi:hypothetical protein
MAHHKKSSKCSCEKKTKKEHKQHKKENSHHNNCGCEPKFYYPLPNLPSQPVGGLRVEPGAWFAPGSVQACCSICSTVKPVYANPCDTCRYDNGTHPINNTSYFTTSENIF